MHVKTESELYIQIKLGEYVTKFMMPQGKKLMTKKTLALDRDPKNSLEVTPSKNLSKRMTKYENKTGFSTLFGDNSDISENYDEDQISEQRQKKTNLKVNKLRIHYFFTENFDIQK